MAILISSIIRTDCNEEWFENVINDPDCKIKLQIVCRIKFNNRILSTVSGMITISTDLPLAAVIGEYFLTLDSGPRICQCLAFDLEYINQLLTMP